MTTSDTATSDTATSDTATYLYAITHARGRPSLANAEGLTGVGGAPVRVLSGQTGEGLLALVSTVPQELFGEAALRRNLEDLAWLEATARAHHGVVDAAARQGPTAPVRLVTLYRDDEQVLALLRERAEDFRSVLARIVDRSEWGVKVYVAQGTEQSPDPVTTGGGGSERPGMAYLKRRQGTLKRREETRRRTLTQAEDLYAALRARAVASRRHPAQDPQLSGRQEWMVLNAAFLVDDGRAGEFRAAVEEQDQDGLLIELTGPWAPYSFAVLDSADEAAAPGMDEGEWNG